MEIEGWNNFYNGWLAEVLLCPANVPEELQGLERELWLDGYKMAKETGDRAIEALLPEIQEGHIKVTQNLQNEIKKLKIAGSMQTADLMHERMKIAKLRVYLKEGIQAMERCIVRKTDGTPIQEVHTQRADERLFTY
jgi:hypothetical protein